MSRTRYRHFIFALEAMNAFATGYYFNWIFFFTTEHLQFGVRENLGLMALHGFIYTGAAWFGGWFGHRVGGFLALKTGFAIMALVLSAGVVWDNALGQLAVVMFWTFGMCFTWPIFQSLISAGEFSREMPRLAGIYNIVWSGVAALSFFIGGALIEALGLKSIFWLPALIHLGQVAFVFWLEKQRPVSAAVAPGAASTPAPEADAISPRTRKLFLGLALLANPFAYVAINTAIPMIPELAQRFELSPQWVGFLCSLWFFVRMGAFVWFWLWPGWHYRFGFLLAAKAVLVLSFVMLLRAQELWVLLIAQVFFGLAVGLIYYSSLFYSMDGGASKSEHGGLHEAMIGLGTFLGALVGAGAKVLWPESEGVSTWAVSGLLLLGSLGMIGMRLAARRGRG